MKKVLFALLSFVMFMPVVSAAENCRIISGNGKDVGSEITCGTEDFYVLENKNNKIKLLAKYNLNVGDKIDYIAVTGEKPTYTERQYSEAENYCYDLADSKGYNPYFVYPMANETDTFSNEGYALYALDGCRVYEVIEEDHIRQDSRAVGTLLVNGKSKLPLYGITYMEPEWGYEAIVNNNIYENEYDENGNLILEGSSFENYINGYKAELESQGFSIDSVAFPTLGTIIDVLERISGKTINVELVYPEFHYETTDDLIDSYTGKMDIKEYASEKYKWLYEITYWLGSGFKNPDLMEYNDYYISNEGFLCALGRGKCTYLPFPIGNGIRPLVTISTTDLLYNIRTQTDGNGTIEVIESAHGGDTISFKVTAKKGLKLAGLTIVTDSGESVDFNEEDLSTDKSGIYSISTNKFTMPYENVTIIARWENVNNPDTGVNNYLIVILLSLITGTIIYKIAKERKDYIK